MKAILGNVIEDRAVVHSHLQTKLKEIKKMLKDMKTKKEVVEHDVMDEEMDAPARKEGTTLEISICVQSDEEYDQWVAFLPEYFYTFK